MSQDSQGLLRVTEDSPAYRETAEAEARYWQSVHPLSLEQLEQLHREGPVDRYINERFTGSQRVHWFDLVASYGPFRRAVVLGTSAMEVEASLVANNPATSFTFVDISQGAVLRRLEVLAPRFPGRIQTRVADLNFLDFAPGEYDLIVSASTIHHVTNLEHLAFQINRGLDHGGYFFLQDYVGEPRFQFTLPKRRLFETAYNREVRFTPGRSEGLHWRDSSDLSPFCGVRSSDILGVFREYLQEVELRTAGTLTVPLLRSVPADGVVALPATTWRRMRHVVRSKLLARFGRRLAAQENIVGERFLRELFLIGDAAADAGLVLPCLAFGVYRKREAP